MRGNAVRRERTPPTARQLRQAELYQRRADPHAMGAEKEILMSLSAGSH